MKKRKFWMIISLLLIVVLLLTGCKKDPENLEIQKGLSQIHFLENRFMMIYNKYMEGEYETKTGELDWDLIEEDYTILDNSISVILIDFASFQVPSQMVVQLENNFSDLNTFLQSREEVLWIQKLCETYQLVVTEIINYFPVSESVKLEKELKAKALYIGYALATNNIEEAYQNLEVFQENYNDISKRTEYLEKNSYKINCIFIEIQKLKNFLEKNDFENSKNSFFELLQDL